MAIFGCDTIFALSFHIVLFSQVLALANATGGFLHTAKFDQHVDMTSITAGMVTEGHVQSWPHLSFPLKDLRELSDFTHERKQ